MSVPASTIDLDLEARGGEAARALAGAAAASASAAAAVVLAAAAALSASATASAEEAAAVEAAGGLRSLRSEEGPPSEVGVVSVDGTSGAPTMPPTPPRLRPPTPRGGVSGGTCAVDLRGGGCGGWSAGGVIASGSSGAGRATVGRGSAEGGGPEAAGGGAEAAGGGAEAVAALSGAVVVVVGGRGCTGGSGAGRLARRGGGWGAAAVSRTCATAATMSENADGTADKACVRVRVRV